MDIKITPRPLSGKVVIPPSKSAAHRAAVCAALALGVSELAPVQETKDMLATIRAARSLGTGTQLSGSRLKIRGILKPPASAVIDCGESGSTLRFFVPVAAALGVNASFRGHGRLPQRPMNELVAVLEKHGVTVTKNGSEILGISGRLQAGVYEIGGSVSSQYITGLLFALPMLDGNSEIILTSQLESRGYVDMTVTVQKSFGVTVRETATGWKIKGKQKYIPQRFMVEGDYSGAAFWLGAAAVGGEIEVAGLNPDSKQGDKMILKLLSDAGADVRHGGNFVAMRHSMLKAFDTDVSQIPDLMPILAVTAAFSDGISRFYNAGRLRFKESDRLDSVAEGLRELGADVTTSPDEIVVASWRGLLGGGVVNSFGDHRIAMSMSIAASFCHNPSVILGVECVDKSYPDFYKDFAGLGGMVDVI